MLLSHAIRKNAVSFVQAQNTYKQNVVEVNTLVVSVLTSKVPNLNNPPPDYEVFISTNTKAKVIAQQWTNEVMIRLLGVPHNVQSYNEIISRLLLDAKQQAFTLGKDPSNKVALLTLEQDLQGLSSQLNLVVKFISDAVIGVQKFQNDLPEMATLLQTIADKSTLDAQADQKQIDQLNADIAKLQSEIQSLTQQIIALGIVDGIAITMGVVATIAAWPAGAIVWFVLGPAVAVATTFIVLDALKIVQDKAKIEADQRQMSGLTADVATLHVLAKNYAQMANQSKLIETNLQAILAEWQTLESDVNTAIEKIKTAISDQSAKNFKAVLQDINDAIDEWNAAYKQAGSLYIELKVNDAQLQIGMSSTDVQNALANGKSMDVISYYNSVHLAA